MRLTVSDSSVPLYQQVCNTIREEIETGVFQPSDRLPSELELCERFGVSRITLRSAIDTLVQDGFLVRRRGKGTYVAPPAMVESIHACGSFTASCIKQGAEPSTVIISATRGSADRRCAEALSISAGSPIILLERLRTVNGQPTIFETDYLPISFESILSLPLENQSLFTLIREHFGLVPDHLWDQFGIKLATNKHSQWLDCPMSTPLLWIGQTVEVNGSPIYYNEQYIRSERYIYAVKYSVF